MPRRRAGRGCRAAAWAAAAAALALFAGCGKKAPLRLPDQRPAERASVPRASVREGRVTLEFKVPAHRLFPEREDPWVLARVLLRTAPGGEFSEVGTILEPGGFEFDAPLAWTDDPRAAGPLAYRVEFRDGARRRRALSDPVEVVVGGVAVVPTGLSAVGDDRAVRLSWSAPPGAGEGVLYRVYRREARGGEAEALTPEAAAALEHADTRVRAGREYCYRVRAVTVAGGVASEGPPSEEVCVRTDDATPPPPPAAARAVAAPGAVQVSWDAVDAPDLLGYLVYRAVGDGPFERVTAEPVAGTAFSDDTLPLEPGTRCRYAVTAVDNAAARNESPFSAAAAVVTVGGAGPPARP